MASQEYLYKMLLRQTYRNLWLTDLMSTIQADFSPCFLSGALVTQHKIEMDKRDGEFGAPPVMAVPPVH